MTVKVFKNGEVIKEFENQKSDFEAFKYILNHQSSSIHHAVKYEGWNAIGYNDDGEEEFNYKNDYKFKTI
jgi:hypothetical protein